MTRYELLIQAMHDTNVFVVRLFLFALFAVLAYPVLGWTPEWMRAPAQRIYLVLLLILFAAVFILGSGV